MTQEKKPQLVHTARQMFETRLAKYNDPHNLEWDFDDIFDKWERHAWSAFLDLKSTEAERDALLNEVARLQKALESIQQCQNEVKCRRCMIIAGRALTKQREVDVDGYQPNIER